ncbi:MAG: hypothetical protein RLZZ165_1626 [Bacteroidota bacterium]|jgi:hypothetical protein
MGKFKMKTNFALWMLLLSGACTMGQADGKLDFVESGMKLQMRESILRGGERQFMLEITTNDVYECSNFGVETHVNRKGGKVGVRVLGVRRTSPCAPGFGVAKGVIDLSALREGEYRVTFTINLQLFRTRLVVGATHYDFLIPERIDRGLLRIDNWRLNKIPEGTIWGECAYEGAARKDTVRRFMEELVRAGAAKTTLPAGDYGDFFLHEAGTTEPRSTQKDSFVHPFVFSYTGKLPPLQAVMDSFQGELRITLKNDKGEELRNF